MGSTVLRTFSVTSGSGLLEWASFKFHRLRCAAVSSENKVEDDLNSSKRKTMNFMMEEHFQLGQVGYSGQQSTISML